MVQKLSIGIIGGGGWLAQTIINALLAKSVFTTEQLGISYRSKAPEHLNLGVMTRDSQKLVDACNTIILSVRPADFGSLQIKATDKLVISVMAGVSAARIKAATGADRVIRAMPNVAASVGYSYTPLLVSSAATSTDRDTAKSIFEACGLCDEVASEDQLDYLTGLTGSGPAFPALLAHALATDAIKRGIPPAIAERAVQRLLVGTGRLMEMDPKPMADIVREFVEYRGVIATAITAMGESGFGTSIESGLDAAVQKVRSLAN